MTDNIGTLDRGFGALARGDWEAGLRTALALCENEDDLGAHLLLARVLVNQERFAFVPALCAKLVDSFVRRGDLPMAVVSAKLIGEFTDDAACEPLIMQIADAFHRDSSRISDVPQAPPPLPNRAPEAANVGQVRADALLEQADATAERFTELSDAFDPERKLPELPLFSALSKTELSSLLTSITITDLVTDQRLITHGDDGGEAYVVARGLLRVSREGAPFAALGPGAVLGEMALVTNTPRAATVDAHEPTTLLMLSRDNLEAIADSCPELVTQLGTFCRGRMVANVLGSPIFEGLGGEDRLMLLDAMEERQFADDHELLGVGHEADRLYLIASGVADVIGVDGDGDELRLATLGPGDVVGEISMVLRRSTNASVMTRSDMVAYELSRETFHKVIRQWPSVLVVLYEMATHRDDETRSIRHGNTLDVSDVVII